MPYLLPLPVQAVGNGLFNPHREESSDSDDELSSAAGSEEAAAAVQQLGRASSKEFLYGGADRKQFSTSMLAQFGRSLSGIFTSGKAAGNKDRTRQELAHDERR